MFHFSHQNLYLKDTYEYEQHWSQSQNITYPFKDATKNPTTEVSRQGGVGDTLQRSQWDSHVTVELLYKADSNSLQDKSIHMRYNYSSNESVLFCLFKQKKKKMKGALVWLTTANATI